MQPWASAERVFVEHLVLDRAKCFLIETVNWKWILSGAFGIERVFARVGLRVEDLAQHGPIEHMTLAVVRTPQHRAS
jgi:hypothetical protein